MTHQNFIIGVSELSSSLSGTPNTHYIRIGVSPSGKALVSESSMRWFESNYPSQKANSPSFFIFFVCKKNFIFRRFAFFYERRPAFLLSTTPLQSKFLWGPRSPFDMVPLSHPIFKLIYIANSPSFFIFFVLTNLTSNQRNRGPHSNQLDC